AGLAVGKDEERVVGGSIPVNADAVESSPCNIAQGFLKERGRNGGVRDDKRESGGEIWMDHPRTLGAAHEVNALARHAEGRRGRLRARIRGADGERKFRERPRGRTAIAGDAGEGA